MAEFKLNAEPSGINWLNQENYLFLNHRLPAEQKKKIQIACCDFLRQQDLSGGYIVISSSGTSSSDSESISLKFIKKISFLFAAESFNQFFKINKNDIFLRALPIFHVGGLAIHARCFLSQSQVIEMDNLKWSPDQFVNTIKTYRVTRASLVPTQVYDLVKMQLSAPKYLDTIFVGGALLNPKLRDSAVALGWPILSSYGMTEASSMLASQKYEQRFKSNLDNKYYPLPQISIRTDHSNKVFISTPGLLSHSLEVDLSGDSHSGDLSGDTQSGSAQFQHYGEGGEYETNDFGFSDGNSFEYFGRKQDLIKISGELVSVTKLKLIFENCLQLSQENFSNLVSGVDINANRSGDINANDIIISSLPHERNENEIVMIVAEKLAGVNMDKIKDHFNKMVLPFERINKIFFVKEIPKTELGKIKSEQLRNYLLGGIQ